MFSLRNKNAFVTGGSSGIGAAITRLFARQEARVTILDVDEKLGQALSDELNKEGLKTDFVFCDVTDQPQMVDHFQRFAELGSIDILVNNAGIAHVGKLEDTPEHVFDRIFQVNVKGVYNGMYAAIPYMKQQKHGVILNMASIVSRVAIPDRFAYTMSKGAVFSMTNAVAMDYLDYNIRCNCIMPGRIHTPFVDGFLAKNYPGREAEMMAKLAKTQPIGRMGEPEEVATLALYLCSDEGTFITGTDVRLDGGYISLIR